jgi:hypothetical protein
MATFCGIDILSETVLSLAQAARRLPQLRGATATGKGVHPVTLWRWARKGLNGPDGQKVRLEVVRIGGTNCTSLEALQRFIDRLQGLAPSPSSYQPRPLNKRAAQAMEELRNRGY